MPLKISDLSLHSKVNPGTYFFDTNVWIYVLGVLQGKVFETRYIDFFNDVFTVASTTKESRIITSSLQVSELFNRLLKIESNKACIKQKYTKGEYAFYKDVFRKGALINTVFNQFKSDFLAYASAVDVVSCQIGSLDDMLNFSPSGTDINDNLYVSLAKANDAVIVTHDSDLLADDLPILTLNNALIAQARNTVVPVKKTL